MDRRKFLAIYEKAKQSYTALNDYVTKEYVKTKTLEEALLQLNELQSVEKQLLTLQEDKEQHKKWTYATRTRNRRIRTKNRWATEAKDQSINSTW